MFLLSFLLNADFSSILAMFFYSFTCLMNIFYVPLLVNHMKIWFPHLNMMFTLFHVD
uniref:Uncharacterized protein n=1 Tax=Solanum lycopersicum TaxID=4081 RepID=A0A3Q7GVA2_SOLLC